MPPPRRTPIPAVPSLHRLNRAEYANAIRDLLGLDVDVDALLPPDDAAYGFDNVADALGSSPALLQAYLSAPRGRSARWRSAIRASASIATPTPSVRICRRTSTSKACRSARRAGCVATHTFPVDGDYEFQLRLWRTNLSAMRGLQDPHQVELVARRSADSARDRRRRRGSRRRCRRTRPPRRTRSNRAAARPRARESGDAADGRGVSRGDAVDARRPRGCSRSSATSTARSRPKARRTCSR